jgi:REP element-mobilizing transposase RayT
MRKPLPIYEGAIYHITQRGNNKAYVFEKDEIKSFFIKQLKEYNKKFDYEILAFVIMDNHYHLLIRTKEDSISKVMFYINNLMGKYLNNKLGRTGHVFEERYYWTLVETDGYLIWVLRYIHRNPVRAHICQDVNDYAWSSHYFYKKGVNSFVNADFILSMLHPRDKKTAINQYLKLVQSTGYDDDRKKDFEVIKQIFNLGENKLSKPNNSEEIIEKPYQKSMDELIKAVNISDEILNEIRNGSRKQSLTPVKIKFIKAALNEKYCIREISQFLNAAPSTISKILSRNSISTFP